MEKESLKNESLKNEDGLYQIWCEWDKDLKFLVSEISEEDKKYINKHSKTKVKTWQKEEEEMDHIEYFKLLVLKCIKGWEGLTNDYLVEVLDRSLYKKKNGWNFICNEAELPKKDHVIEFNLENLRMIAQNRGLKFVKFINYYLEQVEETRKEELREQLKN